MKKRLLFIPFLLLLSCAFLFCSCAPVNPLYDLVSELRLNLYHGESQNYSIKAHYGFREEPYENNAKIGKKVHKLTFKLLDKYSDDATYSLSFTFNSTPYKSTFKLDPISSSLIASVEVENFNLDEFKIYLTTSSTSEIITLKSILPENTIDYKTALDSLYQNQRTMIDGFCDQNGVYNLEIRERITVKDGAPYWYVGLAGGFDNLKALLIDGLNGEILAIREIF